MIEFIKTVVARGDDDAVVYECRHCGTTVDSEDTPCPVCDTADIATIPTR